jgi:hypothetical protein
MVEMPDRLEDRRPPSRAELRARRQESSVRHLQDLYSIAVTVALGFAFEHMVAAHARSTAIVLLVTLVVTLVPFYHGTLRYLDDAYIFSEQNHKEAVLLEFIVRFLESCLFFALAATIENPLVFGWLYVALLATNIVWTRLAQLVCRKGEAPSPPFDWRAINLIVGTAAVFLLAGLGMVTSRQVLAAGILVLALTRTALDYRMSWHFYAAVDDGDEEVVADVGFAPGFEATAT